MHDDYAAGKFQVPLHGWDIEQRFGVLGERMREGRDSAGPKLIDVPGYTFRIFVASCADAPDRGTAAVQSVVPKRGRFAGLSRAARIRAQILTCGAILGRAGRRLGRYLTESWGGLTTSTACSGKYQLRRSWTLRQLAKSSGELLLDCSAVNYPRASGTLLRFDTGQAALFK